MLQQKDIETGWPSELELHENQPNQMKIIGQQNESLGNISLSHEQLMTILASKTDGGIVTIHFQNEEGAINPIQLQIVPEEQVFHSMVPDEDKLSKNVSFQALIDILAFHFFLFLSLP